jgi:hypothetical protein
MTSHTGGAREPPHYSRNCVCSSDPFLGWYYRLAIGVR